MGILAINIYALVKMPLQDDQYELQHTFLYILLSRYKHNWTLK